jgi:hypothetical protein
MVRRNMTKIHFALTNMKFVLNGLSRGLDLSILDRGYGEQFGTKLSFMPTCQALGLVMPSNSPAVNSLWIPPSRSRPRWSSSRARKNPGRRTA